MGRAVSARAASPEHERSATTRRARIVALALDLKLRLDTAGRTSLDDVVRELWRRYGARGIGVPEDGFEQLAAELSGLDLATFFASAVRGTEDPPLQGAARGVRRRARDARGERAPTTAAARRAPATASC